MLRDSFRIDPSVYTIQPGRYNRAQNDVTRNHRYTYSYFLTLATRHSTRHPDHPLGGLPSVMEFVGSRLVL